MNLAKAMEKLSDDQKAKAIKAAQAIVREAGGTVAKALDAKGLADMVSKLAVPEELGKLLGEIKTEVETVAKAGAKHSKETMDKLQEAHKMVAGVHQAAADAKDHIAGMIKDGGGKVEEPEEEEKDDGDDGKEEDDGKEAEKVSKLKTNLKAAMARIDALEKASAVSKASSGKEGEASKVSTGTDGVPTVNSRGEKLSEAELAYERARLKVEGR